MSLIPIARQVRRAVQGLDGAVAFEVTTTITDPGDLPFVGLFVVTINEAADPKSDVLAHVVTPFELRQTDPTAPVYAHVYATDLINFGPDTFARIANVADLTALPRDRTVAVRLGLTTYLTSGFTALYPDVVTATAAFQTVLARLSSLVLAWRQSSAVFNTNPYVDYPLPQVGISVEAQLIATYQAQVAALNASNAARDALRAQADACTQTCAANRAIYAFLSGDVAFLQRAQATVTGLHASLTGGTYSIAPTVVDAVRTFGLDASDPTSFASLLVTKTALLATYQALVRTCDTACQDLQTQVLQAQSLVDAATTNTNTALAAVLAVCPTYNPLTGTTT